MTDLKPISKPKAITATASVAASNVMGRMIASFRNHHLVVDAPGYANGLGEAPVPPEVFLSAIGSCAVGMFELLSSRDQKPMKRCTVDLESTFNPVIKNEAGVTIFDQFTMRFQFEGIDKQRAQELLDTFEANCPLYGSVKMSAKNVTLEFSVAS